MAASAKVTWACLVFCNFAGTALRRMMCRRLLGRSGETCSRGGRTGTCMSTGSRGDRVAAALLLWELMGVEGTEGGAGGGAEAGAEETLEQDKEEEGRCCSDGCCAGCPLGTYDLVSKGSSTDVSRRTAAAPWLPGVLLSSAYS
jgi:hypothetical protein